MFARGQLIAIHDALKIAIQHGCPRLGLIQDVIKRNDEHIDYMHEACEGRGFIVVIDGSGEEEMQHCPQCYGHGVNPKYLDPTSGLIAVRKRFAPESGALDPVSQDDDDGNDQE